MKIEILTNPYFEEEKCLVIDGEVLFQGDYYHNKIDEYIEGFLYGLDYAKIEYQISSEEREWEGCYKE